MPRETVLRSIMTFGFRKEKDYEQWWLQPFAARVCVPDYRLEVFQSTRLFFHLYWRLQKIGYAESQIADHAGAWTRQTKLPLELSLPVAVFDMAQHNGIEAADPFVPFLDA